MWPALPRPMGDGAAGQLHVQAPRRSLVMCLACQIHPQWAMQHAGTAALAHAFRCANGCAHIWAAKSAQIMRTNLSAHTLVPQVGLWASTQTYLQGQGNMGAHQAQVML